MRCAHRVGNTGGAHPWQLIHAAGLWLLARFVLHFVHVHGCGHGCAPPRGKRCALPDCLLFSWGSQGGAGVRCFGGGARAAGTSAQGIHWVAVLCIKTSVMGPPQAGISWRDGSVVRGVDVARRESNRHAVQPGIMDYSRTDREPCGILGAGAARHGRHLTAGASQCASSERATMPHHARRMRPIPSRAPASLLNFNFFALCFCYPQACGRILHSHPAQAQGSPLAWPPYMQPLQRGSV